MKDVSVGTLARLGAIIIVFVLQAFNVFLDVNQLTEGLVLFASIAAGLWAYWKDNDITKKAIQAKEKIKESKKEGEK